MIWLSDDLIEGSDLMIWSNEKKGEWGESESNQRQGERKNYLNIKRKCYSNRAYMHVYCNTCAFMHNFTPIDVDVKMCKMKGLFCILQDFEWMF